MKQFISTLVVAGLLGTLAMSVNAEEKAAGEKPAKVKAEQPPLQEMTLKGEVTRVEKAGKEGKPAVVSFVLVDGENKVNLPQVKAKKAKDGKETPAAYNLEDYVGMKVTVVGQGREAERKGKKYTTLSKITSIVKANEE